MYIRIDYNNCLLFFIAVIFQEDQEIQVFNFKVLIA